MIERITQSFMKMMQAYQAGEECGLVIKHIYVDQLPFERQSDAMAEGSYFEFCLTAALMKGNKIPMPVYMKSAIDKKAASQLTVLDMMQDYRRAHFNAQKVKEMFVAMGLEIIDIQKKLTRGRLEGTLDIRMKCIKEGTPWKQGDKIAVDIKYSGLLYDKLEKHGWRWSDLQKEYHGIQAKQYHFISKLPFYFLVIGNTNKEINTGSGVFEAPDMKMFYIPIDEHMIEQHIAQANLLMGRLKDESEVGFIPKPSLMRCAKCPINASCADRQIIPSIEEVDLTIGL